MNACKHSRSPAVICENVSIAYDGVEVVHDVSFTIEAGSFMPFVGANGAGKTTLLRAIIGLLKPSRGHIRCDLGGAPAGYVSQQRLIDPLFPVSARQLICMGLYPELGIWRQPSRKHSDYLDQVLARFGLIEHQDKTFAKLSGGMKQKTLIARAFLNGANLFVMDEPTSELDSESERDVLSCLLDMCRNDGKTVLLAHHGVDILVDLTSEVCLLQHGKARIAKVDELSLATATPRK